MWLQTLYETYRRINDVFLQTLVLFSLVTRTLRSRQTPTGAWAGRDLQHTLISYKLVATFATSLYEISHRAVSRRGVFHIINSSTHSFASCFTIKRKNKTALAQQASVIAAGSLFPILQRHIASSIVNLNTYIKISQIASRPCLTRCLAGPLT